MGTIVNEHRGAAEGNTLSSRKADAARAWKDIVQHAGVKDEVLARELGWSVGYYSKVASGHQGDLLGMVYRLGARGYPALEQAFIDALYALHRDPITLAHEQLTSAAYHFLSLAAEAAAAGKKRMAKSAAPRAAERRMA